MGGGGDVGGCGGGGEEGVGKQKIIIFLVKGTGVLHEAGEERAGSGILKVRELGEIIIATLRNIFH